MAESSNNGWIMQQSNPGSPTSPIPFESNSGMTPNARAIEKPCALCREATATFVDEKGVGTCDPCTWAATAPYFVVSAVREMELDGRKKGLSVTGVEYYVIERRTGKSVGSRKKLGAAYDLAGYWNRGHELEE